MVTTHTLERRRGLDGFQLKLLALIIMTIDHIYYFGSALRPMPEILTLIGRIAAPIFVFFCGGGIRAYAQPQKVSAAAVYRRRADVPCEYGCQYLLSAAEWGDHDEWYFHHNGRYRHLLMVDRKYAKTLA